MHKVSNWVRRYRYELIAASVGAIIMMTELIGARYIAPHLGTSMFVWTAVIGVILGALSIGYWYGGKLADQEASDRTLAAIILIGATLLLIGFMSQEAVLTMLAASGIDIRVSALLASLMLFAPATAILGMESPYVVKLRLKSLTTAGQSVGRLYAAGTIGSIVGTFAAGYFLIGLLGSVVLGFMLVLALIVVSMMATPQPFLKSRLALMSITIGMMGLSLFGPPPQQVIYDTDSAYSRYQVIEEKNPKGTLRILKMGNTGAQSGIYVEHPSELVFDYTKRFTEAAEVIRPSSVMMIGGGAFTVPRVLADRFPSVNVDVVEIDPKLTELAERFFFYNQRERVTIINQDGRVFLNTNQKRYDTIFVDAFSSLTPPFQLTTREAVGYLSRSITDDGVVIVNIISPFSGRGTGFLKSEYLTYKAVFPSVALLQVRAGIDDDKTQNLIMVAGRQASSVERVMSGMDGVRLGDPGSDGGMVLTDDYAPVEQLLSQQ